MRPVCVAIIVLVLGACAETPRQSLSAAREALAEARYGDAILAAEAGLAGGADEVTAWGLGLVKLEALARGGQGDPTLAQLDALAGARPGDVVADQYIATADQLRAAGDGPAAIRVIDRGLQRFPEDAGLLAQLEAVKQAPAAGSEELELLRSLGYVD